MGSDSPRRLLHCTVYHRIHPDEHARIAETVARFNSHVLVHVGVWEPDARAAPRAAATLTDRAAAAIAPTSDWGRTVAAIEHTAAEVGGSPSHSWVPIGVSPATSAFCWAPPYPTTSPRCCTAAPCRQRAHARPARHHPRSRHPSGRSCGGSTASSTTPTRWPGHSLPGKS